MTKKVFIAGAMIEKGDAILLCEGKVYPVHGIVGSPPGAYAKGEKVEIQEDAQDERKICPFYKAILLGHNNIYEPLPDSVAGQFCDGERCRLFSWCAGEVVSYIGGTIDDI